MATEANAYFRWRVTDAAGDIGIPAPPVVYHATRPAHVESILREGLRTGGVAHGILDPWSEDGRLHFVDAFYGMRPVYVLTLPVLPKNYFWERVTDDGREEPVLLAIDGEGLRLLPDICTFENPHYLPLQPTGIGWEKPVDPHLAELPVELVPYADQHGVVPYSVLMGDAARVAIDVTGTAAVLEAIRPSRISRA